jgi:predicted enzyme related to lactoylglutathione lyase
MTERTSYEPGTPSWVDLSTPDPAAAKHFYGELFGWEAEDAGPPEETGGYAMFTLRGKLIAGVSPLTDENQPAVWSTYVATDDADAVVARATDAGGQTIVEPMDVMDAGRMAFVMHPAAGAIGVWQAGRHKGAELVNEPGALNWNQLHTRDQAGAAQFLEAVFGWRRDEFGGMPMFSLGERGIASMLGMPPGTPDQVPAFWMVIFAAADTDATAAKAKELGGQVLAPPFDIENVGRYAVLTDPQGVAFGVISAPPEAT